MIQNEDVSEEEGNEVDSTESEQYGNYDFEIQDEESQGFDFVQKDVLCSIQDEALIPNDCMLFNNFEWEVTDDHTWCEAKSSPILLCGQDTCDKKSKYTIL